VSILVSVVIRTLNEAKYLGELLEVITAQKTPRFDVEVVVVDSGSTDDTLSIAAHWGARVVKIDKIDFTFGRSLNLGCSFADGDILAIISGHCVPMDSGWLHSLCEPILDGLAEYTYGRQTGRDTTKFSENQLFSKYFGSSSEVPKRDFFVNNANSAIARAVWQEYLFDENILGLEDMELAKRLTGRGGSTGYVAEAGVYHIHDEAWFQTFRRYEREAIALKQIMPEIRLTFWDISRYVCAAIIIDAQKAWSQGVLTKEILSIVKFRLAQYRGSYAGNRFHHRMSQQRREDYFYPSAKL